MLRLENAAICVQNVALRERVRDLEAQLGQPAAAIRQAAGGRSVDFSLPASGAARLVSSGPGSGHRPRLQRVTVPVSRLNTSHPSPSGTRP
jgi:hypothetical protein